MAKIRINFSGVDSANKDLKKLLKQMADMEEDLAELCRRVDPEIQSRKQIRKSLRNAQSSAAGSESKAKKLYNLVDRAVDQYSSTERRLNRNTPDNSIV